MGKDAAPAVPVLVKLLKANGSGEVARALGEIGDKAAIPALVETLESEERSLESRGAAAESLGMLKADGMVGSLVKYARLPLKEGADPNEILKNAAIGALAEFPDKRADASCHQRANWNRVEARLGT